MASLFTLNDNIYAKINLEIDLGFYITFVFEFWNLSLTSVLNTSDVQENAFLAFLTENKECLL